MRQLMNLETEIIWSCRQLTTPEFTPVGERKFLSPHPSRTHPAPARWVPGHFPLG